MNSQTNFNKNDDFYNCFQLTLDESITQFFPEHKDTLKDHLTAQLNRIAHFFYTGVWISEKKLCNWAAAHAEKRLSTFFEGKPLHGRLIRYEEGIVVAKSSFSTTIKDNLKFLLEFVHHPTIVGAILPSSNALAKEIVREIPKDPKAEKRRILEVGPGTGIFTDKIIQRMNPTDELHLVEFDETFCKKLREKYQHIPQVQVFHRSITDHSVESDKKYDFIISGLPLNSFDAPFVKQVFEKFIEISKDEGKISYFDYLALPHIKRLFSTAIEKKNLEEILALKNIFYRQFTLRKAKVLLNAPAARVLHHDLREHGRWKRGTK